MLDLGFGNSICIREAFTETYHQGPLYIAKEELMACDYPNHSGDPQLVEYTRQVIKRQTGNEYKHIFLTNGATGAVSTALRAYHQSGMTYCYTRRAPWYLRYPGIIKNAGLIHSNQDTPSPARESVALIDMPSNPLGMMDNVTHPTVPMIIDGVYLNKVYMHTMVPTLNHTTMIGSYSKLLGINGLRVGWLATNDDLLAARYKDLVLTEYCGISVLSTMTIKHAVYGLEWDRFEERARFKLDMNREEFSLLEKFFDGQKVSDVGMFFYGKMDPKAVALFQKAGVKYTLGSSMGTDDTYGRFNLAVANTTMDEVVEAVFKADRRRK